MHDQAERLREIARQYQQRDRENAPHLLVVTSGKGGVGKSTISLNLAIRLSDGGSKVLLVDADANLGSLDVMLGLAPRFRIGHVLRGERDLEDVLISPQAGLRILPASSGDIEYPVQDDDAVERLLSEILALDERMDFVIVDTGAGLHREILSYCRRADEILVVSGPEPTSVMDAYAVMKVVWSDRPDAAIRLVLNNVHTPAEADEVGGKLSMAVQHFLHRDLAIMGAVPADSSVPRAVQQQQPLMKLYAGSAAALSIQSLASQVMREAGSSLERRMASL